MRSEHNLALSIIQQAFGAKKIKPKEFTYLSRTSI